MKRSVHKTIRISEEIHNYIDTFDGISWNDKFNNMIDHVLKSEYDRGKKIASLDEEIKKRQGKLNELDSVITNAKKALGINSYW